MIVSPYLMQQVISSITSKGQITLPAPIRKHLGVNKNDKIAFKVNKNGTVQVAPAKYPDIASLSGSAGTLKRPLTWSKMRQIAREDRIKAKHHHA